MRGAGGDSSGGADAAADKPIPTKGRKKAKKPVSAEKVPAEPRVLVPGKEEEAAARPIDRDRTLREQAVSLSHCLTHRPKNPFCDVCTMTRSRDVYHRKGAFHRETKAWGDIVTADHIDCRRAEMIGMDDEREALAIQDLHSRAIHVYPVSSKSTEDMGPLSGPTKRLKPG